jgi:hypothetical protein
MKIQLSMTVALCAMLCSCAADARRPYLKREIAEYRGDGEIRDISFRFLWYKIKGYEIIFPPFSLNQPITAEYAIENLPALPHCGIYFSVNGPDYNRSIGHWRMVILDDSGVAIKEVSTDTDKLTWTNYPSGAYSLYDVDNSFFDPKANQRYRIRIEFSMSSPNTVGTGALFIKCGGSI